MVIICIFFVLIVICVLFPFFVLFGSFCLFCPFCTFLYLLYLKKYIFIQLYFEFLSFFCKLNFFLLYFFYFSSCLIFYISTCIIFTCLLSTQREKVLASAQESLSGRFGHIRKCLGLYNVNFSWAILILSYYLKQKHHNFKKNYEKSKKKIYIFTLQARKIQNSVKSFLETSLKTSRKSEIFWICCKFLGCLRNVKFFGNIQYFCRIHRTKFLISSLSEKSWLKRYGDF